MKALWNFTIEYDPANKPQVLSNLMFVSEPGIVEELGQLADLPVAKNNSSPRRELRIELLEDDPRLNLLVQTIKDKLGYAPSPSIIVPPERRDRFYCVRKNRKYTRNDLDQAAFLSLFADRTIANHKDGTAEQVEREVYVAAADRLQSAKTQFGALFPFQQYCVTESLGQRLQQAGVRGLALEPVVILPEDKVRKPLLKLSSSFTAPRSLLPVVNEAGHPIEPNTEWSCYLDDGGYQPHEFKYHKADLEKFQEVDIVMSYERTGVTKARAFRWCIVSQRFRRIMADLKVPGVRYALVRFVS